MILCTMLETRPWMFHLADRHPVLGVEGDVAVLDLQGDGHHHRVVGDLDVVRAYVEQEGRPGQDLGARP
jgi:hypothetical protein